jgi:hypothetical protein
VWAPRWVGLALGLRGILQPLVERATLRDPASLGEALRLAEPHDGTSEDVLLGVSAQALEERGQTPVGSG